MQAQHRTLLPHAGKVHVTACRPARSSNTHHFSVTLPGGPPLHSFPTLVQSHSGMPLRLVEEGARGRTSASVRADVFSEMQVSAP